MRQFDYSKLKAIAWDSEVLSLVAQIHECKGRQEMYLAQKPAALDRLVEIAKKEGCSAICHGCTGKGNDQVRFELTIKAFAPEMKIIAPWRIWDIKSREEAIDYANARGIPVPVSKKRPYSMDRNLWHLSHEGADLEFPENAPPEDLCLICIFFNDFCVLLF